jgi:hypothetical protein
MGPAKKRVTSGAQLMTIATIVSLKNLTDMKLTKMAKLPVITLVARGGTDAASTESYMMYLICLFKYTKSMSMLTLDL